MFETAPFTAPYEIIGQVIAELAVSASVPDFDLWLQLYDVAPDGTAWNLASPGTALLRASYRDGGPERHLVREGEVVRLRFEGPLTANRFLPGHRLRIVLSGRSSRCSRSIRRRGDRSSRARRPGRGRFEFTTRRARRPC